MELTKIAGMSSDLAKRMQKAGINDAVSLAEATCTVAGRDSLSKALGESKLQIYNLAKQADLLRCESISPAEAETLVRSGVRCIEDIHSADSGKLARYIFENGISTEVDEDVTLGWVEGAYDMKSPFEPDPGDYFNESVALAQQNTFGLGHSNMFGTDLSDIITDLGTGIAQAQMNMDLASVNMQKKILEDPEMAALGFNATWYTIPEVSFSLKMEYSYSENGERKISVVPMNATYNNAFSAERSELSTLSLRFVPIPAPQGLTDRIAVPDFVGMTKDEAAEAASTLGLRVEFVLSSEPCKVDQSTMVTLQNLSPGTIVMGNQMIRMVYVEGKSRELLKRLVGSINNRLTYVRNRIAELEVKFPNDENPTGESDPEYEELIRLKYGKYGKESSLDGETGTSDGEQTGGKMSETIPADVIDDIKTDLEPIDIDKAIGKKTKTLKSKVTETAEAAVSSASKTKAVKTTAKKTSTAVKKADTKSETASGKTSTKSKTATKKVSTKDEPATRKKSAENQSDAKKRKGTKTSSKKESNTKSVNSKNKKK
ncbi:MAG: DUF4332 domain-containing protein [Lachnospiraceae bacterium]|nr:DUF4332 domain-containing protein [Lachnospiraceae bacterium]